MTHLRCPVCQFQGSTEWILLAEPGSPCEPPRDKDGGSRTHICPRCTAGTTILSGSEPIPLAEQYLARTWRPDPISLQWEDEHGEIQRPNRQHRVERVRERLLDLGQTVGSRLRSASILDAGCRDGLSLQTFRELLPITAVGLEPWTPWRTRAEHRGLEVMPVTLETWADDRRFDVVLDCDVLQHLKDPREHLRNVAKRLNPGGVAMIEVPNLLGVHGDLQRDVLQPAHMLSFTPRALTMACRQVGLGPVKIHAGTALRVICRRVDPSDELLTVGPDARTVAELVLGNELRRTMKFSLSTGRATPHAVQWGIRTHAHSNFAPTRADLAIELASYFDRCSDYRRAAEWLQRSLADRRDPEVEQALTNMRGMTTTMRYDAFDVQVHRHTHLDRLAC